MFVREAERILARDDQRLACMLEDWGAAVDEPLSADERHQLKATVERMRAGEEMAGSDDTVDGWLERLRDHYP
jgi:hypothetical protein